MDERWIVITDARGERRERLRPGLTRLGGGAAEIPVAGAGADQVHLWDEPPRAVFVGAGPPPVAAEGAFEELALSSGSAFEWRSVRFRYEAHGSDVLEEIAVPNPGAFLPQAEIDAWRRVHAGILVELGLAERVVTRNWQNAVRQRGFRPDECAREILARSAVGADDVRVEQRTAMLLRDFLMAPLAQGARGAGRRARRAAQGGIAFFLAQGAAFLVFCLIVVAVLVILRLKGISLDGWLDRLLLRPPG